MKKGEKQRKFHEAFMKIFFPPQPIQQTPQQQVEDEPVVFVREGADANSGSDDDDVEERNASADASDCMSDKLTRSQRKRIRRRKLKEAASRRRKIIGPLLPSTHEDTKGEPSNLEKEKQLHEDSCIDKSVCLMKLTPENKLQETLIAERLASVFSTHLSLPSLTLDEYKYSVVKFSVKMSTPYSCSTH